MSKHCAHFNAYELKSLGPVLERLGCTLDKLTKGEVKILLKLFYSLPYRDRSDPRKSLVALVLVRQLLSTFLRAEIGCHAADPGFLADVERLIGGSPSATIPEEQIGLFGLLESVRSVAARGY